MPSTLHVSPSFITMEDYAIEICTTSYRLCLPKAPPFCDTDGLLEHDDLTLPCIEHPNASSIVSIAPVSTKTYGATPSLTLTLSTTMSCSDLAQATTMPLQLHDPMDVPCLLEFATTLMTPPQHLTTFSCTCCAIARLLVGTR